MCMLIYHPADAKPFSKDEFRDFNRKNPHGFGAIWRSPNGTVRSKKGLLDIEAQWALYRKLVSNGCTEMVLHWRMRTSGPLSEAMCHPFKATGDVLVMHNGMLPHRSTREKSDTMCFIEDVINPLLDGDPSLYYDDALVEYLDAEIGPGNKLVLWRAGDEKPVLVGEAKGVWYKGRWMSNTYAWTVPRDCHAWH